MKIPIRNFVDLVVDGPKRVAGTETEGAIRPHDRPWMACPHHKDEDSKKCCACWNWPGQALVDRLVDENTPPRTPRPIDARMREERDHYRQKYAEKVAECRELRWAGSDVVPLCARCYGDALRSGENTVETFTVAGVLLDVQCNACSTVGPLVVYVVDGFLGDERCGDCLTMSHCEAHKKVSGLYPRDRRRSPHAKDPR
jgi:hypothetical protein